MDIRAVFEVCAAILVSLGGGGAIVRGFSDYLGKRWADRALEKQKQEYAQLNIAFTNQLDLATRRIQVELDALGHLHKLRTAAEFEKLQELWKRIAGCRSAFNQLSFDGYGLDEGKRRNFCRTRSEDFSARFADLRKFLNEEMLSIPSEIANAVRLLLESRTCTYEMAKAAIDPEVLSPPGGTNAYETFIERRTEHAEQFSNGANEIELLMRKFLHGDGKPGTEPPGTTAG